MATRVGASNPTAAAQAAINAQNTAQTAQTANVQATTATTAAADPAKPEIVGDPNASGAPKVATRKVEGFPENFSIQSATSAGRSGIEQGVFGEYVAPVNRGFDGYTNINDVKATDDGFVLDYTSYTKRQGEEAVMMLVFPLLDKKSGEMSFLPLDVLSSDKKGGTFTEDVGATKLTDPVHKQEVFGTTKTFKFSLKQINAYLKKTGLGVQLNPGDRLAIAGVMKGSGHRIANTASNSFEVPTPVSAGAQSVLAAQIGNATNQSIKAKDLPLDVTAMLPKNVLDARTPGRYTRVGDILEGEITTRLESEYKGSVTKDQMGTMLDSAYALAELSEKADGGDKAARAELDSRLGPGLRISAIKRHWVDESGVALGNGGDETKVARDANGRPKLDTMVDAYSDVKDLTWTKISGAIRMRGNAQKSGHAEFKLGGGVLDPKTGIRQRTELGMSTKPGTTEDQLVDVLKLFADKGNVAHYSIGGHLIREAEELGLKDALIEGRTVWADVRQDRHKFEVEDIKTGVKSELSLDTVVATTTRPEHEVNGKPQTATFYVVESELDHLQIASANVTEAQNATKKTAITTTEEQEKFLTSTKAAVDAGTVELEPVRQPTLHGKEHVDEGSFRKTNDYKIFEKMNKAILDATTPGFDPGPARQKAAHFAELLGLVPPEGQV